MITAAHVFVMESNKDIEKLQEQEKALRAKEGYNSLYRQSMFEEAEPWAWGTDLVDKPLFDNQEDYIIEMEDETLVRWNNYDGVYEEITEDGLTTILEKHNA